MPRVKLPPTPTSSVGPTPKDKGLSTTHEMESAFVLPPAAMKPSPPASPVITRKRTLSGSAKVKDVLPPPPSRTRKIIQMKPKQEAAVTATGTSVSGSAPGKTGTGTPHGKRKQPSATSAAGRRIARKTAHSIIERRRRSKMNEEFGVLKDMIPACNGVEMHKLAILQAGIEYVRYLQGCVEKLQDREDVPSFEMRRDVTADANNDDNDDEDQDEDMDHNDTSTRNKTSNLSPNKHSQYRRESTATTSTSAHHSPSPSLRPNISSSSLSSQRQLPPLLSKKTYSTSPPPLAVQTPMQTGVSPAFNAIHFSPELGRALGHGQASMVGKGSPNILPLPQAAMAVGGGGAGGLMVGQGLGQGHGQSLTQPGQSGDVHAEATATAALLMMGSDRRGNGGGGSGKGRGSGMSVRDLLSH